MRAPVTLTTTKVQGPDSYVTITTMSFGEREANEEAINAGRYSPCAEQRRLIMQHVIDWNWTDAEGKRLPIPKDDPDVISGLSSQESGFLADAITSATPEKLKN